MRSTLKVNETRLQLFFLQESPRPPLTLDLMQLTISQVVLRQRKETSQQEHHLLKILGAQATKDRRHKEISGYFWIHKQERQLSKQRTKRQTQNFIDCENCKIRRNPEDREIPLNKAARNSAGLRSIPCGEADRPTSVESGQLLRWISPGSRIGPIKELSIFNTEGNVDIDVKVPSTSKPEILMWVNACTEEVQHCCQIAEINTVILTQNQNNETSEGSRKPVAQGVNLASRNYIPIYSEEVLFLTLSKDIFSSCWLRSWWTWFILRLVSRMSPKRNSYDKNIWED